MSLTDDGLYLQMYCDHDGCKKGMGVLPPKGGQEMPPLPLGWKEVEVEHKGKKVKRHYCPQHQPPKK